MGVCQFTSKEENIKFSVSIRNRLRQVKRQSLNQENKFYFLRYPFTINGFSKIKSGGLVDLNEFSARVEKRGGKSDKFVLKIMLFAIRI